MRNSTQADVGDTRILDVALSDDELTVALIDGRRISVPLAWFPRLLTGTSDQRAKWELAGAGLGIHWPDLDEDISAEGLLRGARPSCKPQAQQSISELKRGTTSHSNALGPVAHPSLIELSREERVTIKRNESAEGAGTIVEEIWLRGSRD